VGPTGASGMAWSKYVLVRVYYDFKSRPDNGISIVGKCLGPKTSKGLRKMAAKYFKHRLANKSVMFLCILSTKLSIFTFKYQFHAMT